ncbi:MAG: tetratricopeptide repeat protein, partial [Planctomycetaceae bacterium]|nr:tetratricopeptide repeat protein [Planctomycetaceae bacterium]
PPPITSPEMITALADYWIVRGKPEWAIPLYEKTLALGNLDDTRAFVFRNNLAMLYSHVLGQHQKALEVVDKALETNRDNFTLLNTKGLILINAGRPADAIPVLQRAVELSHQLPIYCMHLAYAFHLDGRVAQARRYFDVTRDQLVPLAPSMTKENKAMYDALMVAYPPVGM